ncbi:MAG: helix-turn-helix domain-containing protein, partial [Bacteroidetes bacterium]|nr:helix-turn-helix domain-containing protein [Bacteroidota bacterium]
GVLTLERVVEAKEQIAATDDDLKAIAYRLGYVSFGKFAKDFEDILGFSPYEIRIRPDH